MLPNFAQLRNSVEPGTPEDSPEAPASWSLSQPSPASGRRNTDETAGAWCCGTLVQHAWRDSTLADALRAGRSAPIPADVDSCVTEGFEAAVTEVLQAMTEAVRIRCRCIDEGEPPRGCAGLAKATGELAGAASGEAGDPLHQP